MNLAQLLLRRHPEIGRRALRVLLAATTIAAGANAVADGIPAPSGISLTDAGGKQSTLYGVATYWDSICTCAPLTNLGLDTRVLAQIAYWHGTQRPTDHPYLWEGSVTPALRWIGPSIGAVGLIAEAGIGVSALSAVRLNETRHFASVFQFNEHIGVGLAFGPKHRYEFLTYLRHVSNGSIKQPNDGDTFFGGAFRVPLD
jgi:Lipid A 3-O-deacylase (PagL)